MMQIFLIIIYVIVGTFRKLFIVSSVSLDSNYIFLIFGCSAILEWNFPNEFYYSSNAK